VIVLRVSKRFFLFFMAVFERSFSSVQ